MSALTNPRDSFSTPSGCSSRRLKGDIPEVRRVEYAPKLVLHEYGLWSFSCRQPIKLLHQVSGAWRVGFWVCPLVWRQYDSPRRGRAHPATICIVRHRSLKTLGCSCAIPTCPPPLRKLPMNRSFRPSTHPSRPTHPGPL
jgi:hypothetical protein